MRVLMLAQFYPPLIGGEERFVRDLSVQLAARGHDVSVVTLQQAGLPAFETDQGVRIYRVGGTLQRVSRFFSDTSRRHAAPLPDPELMAHLRRVIRLERPEIVHGHNWMVHAFLPLKRWSKARLVMSLHDYSLVCAKKKLIYRDSACSGPGPLKCLECSVDHYGLLKGPLTALGNWAMSAAERAMVDIFLPVSQAVAESNGLTDHALPYRIVTPFVPDEIAALPDADEAFLNRLPQEPFLLFVGAFGRYKGVDVLLQAHAALDDPPPLVIIGYQTSEHPVQTTDLAANVTVILDAPRAHVMAACRRSLLCLVPSVWAEPFGIVALEAMACGRAVIASEIGGLRDIVQDGVTGLLVPPGDVAALSLALQRLIQTPGERERMGAAGRQRLREFLASTVTPRYENVYRDLLAAHDSAETALRQTV
jgi:glycosyltransferase involved in cell wall biosynthesis